MQEINFSTKKKSVECITVKAVQIEENVIFRKRGETSLTQFYNDLIR